MDSQNGEKKDILDNSKRGINNDNGNYRHENNDIGNNIDSNSSSNRRESNTTSPESINEKKRKLLYVNYSNKSPSNLPKSPESLPKKGNSSYANINRDVSKNLNPNKANDIKANIINHRSSTYNGTQSVIENNNFGNTISLPVRNHYDHTNIYNGDKNGNNVNSNGQNVNKIHVNDSPNTNSTPDSGLDALLKAVSTSSAGQFSLPPIVPPTSIKSPSQSLIPAQSSTHAQGQSLGTHYPMYTFMSGKEKQVSSKDEEENLCSQPI
jgi:hypothetical protein